MANLESRLQPLAEQALAAHGLNLVCARLSNSGPRLTVQVLAEKPDETSPTVEECRAASRTLAAQLDVADLIPGRYTLEVGSPGLDRPLIKAGDYRRFIGRHAKLSFAVPQTVGTESLGAVSGTIADAGEDAVSLLPDGHKEPMTFAYQLIRHAHLVPSAAEYAALMKNANLKQKQS